jgi:hypothetical protein
MKSVLSNRNRISLTVVISSFMLLVPSARIAVAYTTGTAIYTPPSYTTFQPPANGGSYTDAVFGTAIKRISDAMHTTAADRGGAVTLIAQEYSTMSPFNMDNTRLLLQHLSYFAVYDGAGNFLKDLYQYGINTSSEPRWSRTDPNEFYYVAGNSLKKFNVGTNFTTTVHTFSEYSSISGMGESDISFDGKYFVLAGNRRYVFLYDLTTDTKSAVFDPGTSGLFDNLYITPDNNVIIGWYASGSNRYNGVELYDKNLTFQRQLTHAMGHMDVTRDTTGDEIMLWANGADPQLQVRCDAGVTKIRLADARQTCVWTGEWSLAIHISATDNNGWFFVDTYNPKDVMPPNGWVAYTDEILQIKTDGTEVRRIAHHRSRPLNSYTYQPKASVSRDGSRLVYTSNHGLQAQLGYPTEYTDTYLVDLGSTTAGSGSSSGGGSGSTGGTNSGTTRIEETDSAVSYSGSWYSNANGVHSGGSANGAIDLYSMATLSFTGNSMSFILYTDEWSGYAAIYVDGVLKSEIDTFASPAKARANVYTISGLADGAHTASIRPSGQKNVASGGYWIWLDAFDVTTKASTSGGESTTAGSTSGTTTPTVTRVQENESSVTYKGSWHVNKNAVYSGGSAIGSMDARGGSTLAFNGTGASFILYTDEWSGIATISVDGVAQTEVDTYASPAQAQVNAYTISGLSPGPHTVSISPTGRRNPSSRGLWIWVDAFDVTN